jgi:hypothetical protein
MRENKLKIAQNWTGEYPDRRGFSAVPGAEPKPNRESLVDVEGVGRASGMGDAAVGGR